MKSEKAIEILEEVKELDDTMYAYNPAYMNAMDMAIEALEEIQLYKDNKLCLVPKDVYSRQCSELDAYKEIGTVEECREAVEKLSAKIVSDLDYELGYYTCPSCGTTISFMEDGYKSHKCCLNCGQAIQFYENLEGMEENE